MCRDNGLSFALEQSIGHFSQAAFSEEVFIRPDVESHWLNLKTLARGSEEMAGMVGRSGLIRGMFSAVERLGPYKATVLIQGESGTGKELVARALTRCWRGTTGRATCASSRTRSRAR